MRVAKPGSLLFLSRADVIALGATEMSLATMVVQKAFAGLGTGNVLQPAKTSLKYAGQHEKYGGLVNVLPAAYRDESGSVYGLKALGAMPSNVERGIPRATGVVLLFDGETKTPVALMDGQVISAMRTGAVSALAAEKLCRTDSKILGLIGAGVNMRTQLLGLLHALPGIKEVRVYSRGDSKHDFVRAMSQRFPAVMFTATDTAEQAAEAADVVVTCVANSDAPVIAKEAVNRPGVTVFNIGCLENEPELLADMDLIVSDYWEHSKHRGVQTHAVAYQRGIIGDDDVVNLDEIVAGSHPGRTSNEQRVFFCPTGLGVEDVVFAQALAEKAVAEGVGTYLQLWGDAAWI